MTEAAQIRALSNEAGTRRGSRIPAVFTESRRPV